jgi:hypothetical protein
MKCGTKAKKYAAGGEASKRDKAIVRTENARREEAQQRKMVADARREEKEMRSNEENYNRSLTSPEMVNPPKTKKAMGGMVKGYAEGGMVKKRGMGAATRGGNCKIY